MKFSYNWLRELVPGLQSDPLELMGLITMKTAECEGVEPFAPWLAQICVARVQSVEPIDGSHNVKAVVDAGSRHGVKQLVCGAPNCKPGVLTAYVPAGVSLNGKEIRKAVIAGVESDGMLASGAELGVNRDHEGIAIFSEGAPGDPLPGIAPDYEIEVDNKSLTHRPDLWGHHGMAREVAAFSGLALKDPADLSLLPAGKSEWNAEILHYDLAPRYSALVFENVKVEPSPLWLQARLTAIGLNPISNIVDATNYVMAELAEPMHAFDADKLHGRTIFVRRATQGESFAALNGETYTLDPSNLVIADGAGCVALAGVIGGAGSAISESTTRIVLESANFQAANIRKTSSALKLRTDASMRFEKAQDPVNTVRALARAVVVLKQVCPGIRLVGGLVDNWRPAPPPAPIDLPMEWLVRKLGRDISGGEVRAILESLEFTVAEPKSGVFSVGVPSWRATKDITIKDDLLEEIGRIVGYGTVPPVPPQQPVQRPWINESRLYHHDIRKLACAQGFTESMNYSFISEEMAARFGLPLDSFLRVANPISVEQVLMRTSLLPGVHRNILDNARFLDEFRLFEIGVEIHKRGEGELPDEIPHLMAAVFTKGDGTSGLFEAKRLAECLLPGCTVAPCQARGFEHPARTASVEWRGRTLGRLFELHPSLLETGRAAILDLDLRASQELAAQRTKYTPLRRFPTSAFDLSVVAGLREISATIANAMREAAGAMCDSVEYLYSYRGNPLPEDKQSMTYRVTVSAPDHTLTADEVTAVRTGIISALQSRGYELRV